MAVCRLMIIAFQGHDNFGFDGDDLTDGIAWAEDLLKLGITKAPHDEIDLVEFIAWARNVRELWATGRAYTLRCWCSKCKKWVTSETHQKDHIQFLRIREPVKQTGGK